MNQYPTLNNIVEHGDTIIVAPLNRELNEAYDRPDVQARLAAQHSQVIKYTPEKFVDFLKVDSDRYRVVIKDVGIAVK